MEDDSIEWDGEFPPSVGEEHIQRECPAPPLSMYVYTFSYTQVSITANYADSLNISRTATLLRKF